MARESGHGVGKSTVAAWAILWGLSTMPNTRVVVTANTDTQLRTKTWPEATKWLTATAPHLDSTIGVRSRQRARVTATGVAARISVAAPKHSRLL